MSSTYLTDRKRGSKEARQQLTVLRQRWPLAFPAEPKDVRPLAMGAAAEIASSMRWSLPYTLGVLASWKMGPPYCDAVLCHDHRVALDGSAAETIDADAKDLATKQLARLAARETAKTQAAEPAEWKPKPVAAPLTETTGQLRARVRALLLGRTT
jgi:sRNA-binding protein